MNAVTWNLWPRRWGILEPFRPEGGLGIRIAFGPFVRPLSWLCWRGFAESWWPFYLPNPWSEWRWITVRLPFVVLPFVSYRRWRSDGSYFGLYWGGKTYRIGDDPAAKWPHKGHTYARPAEMGQITFTGSATFRWSSRA